MKKLNKIWDDCICGINKTVHTMECKINHRANWKHNYFVNVRKALRKERKKKHLCASCGKKVEPKMIYTYRCEDCLDKIRKYSKKKKLKK